MGLQSQTRLSKPTYASLFSMAVPRSIKAMSSTSSSKHEHLINYFFKKKRNFLMIGIEETSSAAD